MSLSPSLCWLCRVNSGLLVSFTLGAIVLFSPPLHASDATVMGLLADCESNPAWPLQPADVVKRCSSILEDQKPLDKAMLGLAYRVRGEAHLRLSAYSEAAGDFEAALKYQPSNPLLKAKRLFAKFRQGPSMELAVEAEQLHRGASDCSMCSTVLGCFYWKAGNIDEAISTLQHAVDLDKADTLPLYLLAGLYTAYYRYDDAIEVLARSRQTAIDHPYYPPEWSHALQGVCYVKLLQPRRSIACFQSALVRNPKSYHAWCGLSLAYSDLELPHFALSSAQSEAECSPERVEPILAIAKASIALNQAEEAVKWLEKASEIDPEHISVELTKARLLLGKRKYADGSRFLFKLSKTFAGSHDLLFEQARLLATCPVDDFRDGKEALRIVDSVKDKIGHLPPAWQMVQACVLAELHNVPEALRLARGLLPKVDPESTAGRTLAEMIDSFEAGKAYHSVYPRARN